MLGKFYQYKDNKGTNWPLYGNMQDMLSLGEGAFQCLLSIALVIIELSSDWQMMSLTESWFGSFFVGVSKHSEEKLQKNYLKYMTHI